MKVRREKIKVNVVTLGCSKNLVDSERLMGQLTNENMDVAHDSNDRSDVVIVNTCGFIQDAKEESVDTILRFLEAKQEGLVDKVYVMGCLSQRYRADLKDELPEVDGVFGVEDHNKILQIMGVDYKKSLVGERQITTPPHYAYLKISEGCDHRCSFCAIPLIRGKHKSVPIPDLVIEAKKLAAKGVKELILIAQDLTYYGIDIAKQRQLGDLLKELVKIEGIEWIRLHYAYPTSFPLDVLELMKKEAKVCSYMDIPLQHVSTKILKSMRRGIDGDKTKELISEFRRIVPDLALRTTLIVGYPGETEEDFEALKNFVIESRFDRLGVFTYSPEENTTAFDLDDDIPENIKQDRADQIMAIQQQISLEINESKIGKTFKVIIDREEGDYFVGRTMYDSPEVDNEVLIEKDANEHHSGDMVQVKVVGAQDFDLFAEFL